VALSISPILVRSADEPARLTIRPGTDVVRLLLQAGPADGGLFRGRAIVRTVAGREVWRGPAAEASGPSPRELARVDIPAASLAPDDYIVQLFGSAGEGVEVERHRYFFSVREP
jgi:hypothetical protein